MEQIDVDMGAGEPTVLSNVTMDSDKCTLKTKISDNIEIKKTTRDEDILRKLRAFANCLISGAT